MDLLWEDLIEVARNVMGSPTVEIETIKIVLTITDAFIGRQPWTAAHNCLLDFREAWGLDRRKSGTTMARYVDRAKQLADFQRQHVVVDTPGLFLGK